MQKRVLELLEEIKRYQESIGDAPVTLDDAINAPHLEDGIKCIDVSHIVSFCQLYLVDKSMSPDQVVWDETSVRQLEHVARCKSCLSLTFLQNEQVNKLVDGIIERLKTDAKIPEDLREAVLMSFGAPKDERFIN